MRLTILDPVGLGRNFAGFMHLADYSEALVNSRIWTEPQQIDARLSELNVHVESVIQNYLRNEFPTIESYNVQAAEVAEPYRILVVPDFPVGLQRIHGAKAPGDRAERSAMRGLRRAGVRHVGPSASVRDPRGPSEDRSSA